MNGKCRRLRTGRHDKKKKSSDGNVRKITLVIPVIKIATGLRELIQYKCKLQTK